MNPLLTYILFLMKVISVLIFLIVLCLIPLIFGMESILMIGLPGGLPLGTLMAALAVAYGSLLPVILSKPASLLRRISWGLLAASVVWLPLGIYLSGNPALNFVQDAVDSQLFWRYTGILSGCIGGILVITTVKLMWERRTARRV